MLSLKKGNPIAQISNRKKDNNNKKILYLLDDNYKCECCNNCDKKKCNKKKCCKNCEDVDDNGIPFNYNVLNNTILSNMKGRMKYNEYEKLKHALSNNNVTYDNIELINNAKKLLNKNKQKEIFLNDEELNPVPDINKREVIYIAGPSGSGKSTYVSKYINYFNKLFPDKAVYIISRLKNDDVIDKHHITRITLDDDFIDNPIEMEELANSLVVFDDTDTIQNKAIKDRVNSLKEDLLETGRHEDIYVIVTSHLINNYKESRKILNECHSMTLFPSSGSSHAIHYCLKNYFGLDRNQVSKILKLPSRWVTIKKNYPQLVLYSKGCYLLSNQ
jgi:hypothetical protein